MKKFFINKQLSNTEEKNNLFKVKYYRGLSTMSQYMREHPDEFEKKIKEFTEDMDPINLQYFSYYKNQLEYMPINVDIEYLYFDNNSTKLFSKEQEMLYLNEKSLYEDLKSKFYNIDFVSLEHLYFKSGIFYLPKDITDKFKNTICIDVGAYIGDTAVVFSNYEFEKIYAFEVDIVNFNEMKKNLELFGNKTIIPCNIGIGDENTSMKLDYSDKLNDGSTLLYNRGNNKTYNVEIVKLDDYFENTKNQIGLIKLDIEGFEEKALLGAKKIITKNKPVLLIACYHDWLAFGQMFKIKKWIKELNMGYKILFRHDDYKHLLNWCLIAY